MGKSGWFVKGFAALTDYTGWSLFHPIL